MQGSELTKEQFRRIEHLLPGRAGTPGAQAKDNHLFLNAVLWILKTQTPWRRLPEEYGSWKNVHKRFSRWCGIGVFDHILQVLTQEEDREVQMLLRDRDAMRTRLHPSS